MATQPWYKNAAVLTPWIIILGFVVATLTILIPIPTFNLSSSHKDIYLRQGEQTLFSASVTVENNYKANISLSFSKVLPGITASYSKKESVAPFTSKIFIKADKDTPTGINTLNLIATGADGKQKNIKLKLHVKDSGWSPNSPKEVAALKYSNNLNRNEIWSESVNIIPYSEQRYADVFGGVKNTIFYAYNAPWRIEGKPGSLAWKKAIETQIERYTSSSVHSKYLFFDQASLVRAKTLWREVNKRVSLEERIEIRLHDDDSVKNPVFFFWSSNHGDNTAILYPEPFLNTGRPQLLFEVVNHIETQTLLKQKFDMKWNQASPINIFID